MPHHKYKYKALNNPTTNRIIPEGNSSTKTLVPVNFPKIIATKPTIHAVIKAGSSLPSWDEKIDFSFPRNISHVCWEKYSFMTFVSLKNGRG